MSRLPGLRASPSSKESLRSCRRMTD